MRKSGIWSATRIDVANYCRMRYYLVYIKGEQRLNLSAYEKGSLLHNLIEKFWIEKNGIKVPRYASAEEFTKKAQGKWVGRFKGAEKTGRKIEWRVEDEKWMIKNVLPDICIPLYNYLVSEGPPLYTELPFRFSFLQGNSRKIFRGKIDEVRTRDGEVIIRDYKSGNPWIGDMKVEHDPQMTIYNVGLCALCYASLDFARTLGLEEEAKKFMGHPVYISDKIHPEFFMIEAFRYVEHKIPPQVIHKTSRKDEHFLELIRMINGTINAVQKGNIYPERGRKCDSCDVKYACAKRVELARNTQAQDLDGQLMFDFAAFDFQKAREPVSEPKVIQKKFRLRKKDNSLVLR